MIWSWILCGALALGPGEINRVEVAIVGQIGWEDYGSEFGPQPVYGRTPWVLEAETTGLQWNDAAAPTLARGEIMLINIVSEDEAGNRGDREACE